MQAVMYQGEYGMVGEVKRRVPDGLAEVDAALEAWARWGRGTVNGWPMRTLLARVIEQGFTGAAQQGAPVEMSEAVQLVEKAVLRLREIERKVIVKHYVNWQAVEVSARSLGMSPGRFRTVLHRARRSVRDYMDGAGLRYNTTPGTVRA